MDALLDSCEVDVSCQVYVARQKTDCNEVLQFENDLLDYYATTTRAARSEWPADLWATRDSRMISAVAIDYLDTRLKLHLRGGPVSVPTLHKWAGTVLGLARYHILGPGSVGQTRFADAYYGLSVDLSDSIRTALTDWMSAAVTLHHLPGSPPTQPTARDAVEDATAASSPATCILRHDQEQAAAAPHAQDEEDASDIETDASDIETVDDDEDFVGMVEVLRQAYSITPEQYAELQRQMDAVSDDDMAEAMRQVYEVSDEQIAEWNRQTAAVTDET